MHTTQNHNGQLTNQLGIHAFWESRLPELFAQHYNYFVGRAVYLTDPLAAAWKIIRHTHQLTDSVLKLEAALNSSFPQGRKYSYSRRNNQVVKQYSAAYAKAYDDLMQHMVEKQMRAAILSTGSYWYAAWVDAGQPLLENMTGSIPDTTAEKEALKIEAAFKKGKIIGREN